MLTGLGRTVLKCTIPGIPDIYQGTEFWDLSLVDPDNRRAVDYTARAQGLQGDAGWQAMLQSWPDGRLKQRVLARLLSERAAGADFFAKADYQPLRTDGAKARHLLAFRRSYEDEALVVVVPRLLASVVDGVNPPLGQAFWESTSVSAGGGRWRDVVTGAEVTSEQERLPVGELFSALPIAVLRAVP
jgi:(1->4)-alpha-D-glucan 1-alpha-D-glucosylmutase